MFQKATVRVLRIIMVLIMIFVTNPTLSFAQEQSSSGGNRVVNVQLIFDSSGSMAAEIAPGVTRIDAAKDVLNDVVDAIPEQEGINVGFRVYGHEGSNREVDRAASCLSTELVVPMQGTDKNQLRAAIDSYQPVGWTPITLSLNEAANDFSAPGENEVNAIVLVTDGLETCGGNACEAAVALAEGDVDVTTYVVGFGLTQQEQSTLQCIADAGGGLNLNATNADELNDALFTVLEELQVVILTGFLELEEIGGVWPRATLDCRQGATDSNPDGEVVSYSLEETNRIEVNVGTCELYWLNPSGSETRLTVLIQSNETTWVRGSILKFPQGAGEIYTVTDISGTVIWQDQFEYGDYVWVLPGIYRMELLERVGNPILISAEVQTLPGTVTDVFISTAGS